MDEYFLDLRNFFRYLKWTRDPALQGSPWTQVSIRDVDLTLRGAGDPDGNLRLYDLPQPGPGASPNSDRSAKGLNPPPGQKVGHHPLLFMGILQQGPKLEEHPGEGYRRAQAEKRPCHAIRRWMRAFPCWSRVDGPNRERDLYSDAVSQLRTAYFGADRAEPGGYHDEALRVLGKGNKVRMVYLNQACQDTLAGLSGGAAAHHRPDRDALFLSGRNQRISRSMVNALVKKHLSQAGLDSTQYSSHKLRHTAATLMLQNGVDVRAVQEVLGHEHLNTTEIYTHIDNEGTAGGCKGKPLVTGENQRENQGIRTTERGLWPLSPLRRFPGKFCRFFLPGH